MSSFSYKAILKIIERNHGSCECCGLISENSPHHCFYKSQYFGKDKNESWNGANVCEDCHRIIHHPSSDRDIEKKYKLDFRLKSQALGRYHGKNTKALEDIIRRAEYNYAHYTKG